MAEFFDALTDKHIAMIGKQRLFFVATACAEGRINLSPKGLDTFRVLDKTRVAYLDLGGSGNETQAHITADGRITIMFCNFENPALILRLYGHGKVILPQDNAWDSLVGNFMLLPGTRQIFDITIDSVQTSCGWGVPHMEMASERETLTKYHAGFDPEERLAKISSRTKSIDGLPVRLQTYMPHAQKRP
ncbi:pyridoxamine 5'-phosphate oxidase family protein [Alterisphingorhabdus coralli]|uniref:Pyridoxamine 5'-phosphate oxidase family protein n=1 Tax=Alterisphingorhabdus coralli TaxID=3071408 RepID=A0AA97F6A2_9SPHN|nr:pyridoxamine 5'-phosphate oxidase family protein [Parasphingorhabdus sp. SCSIO 66989]WOE75144.1 pyridoxamine 5'-phosphate oxidase family protein [Parasphingorhabdus sp. SCSIO 66989]